jgi:hypothetical protein
MTPSSDPFNESEKSLRGRYEVVAPAGSAQIVRFTRSS